MVGNSRSCSVSFTDIDGITHSVEVTAESLYEAAALGLKAFRDSEWAIRFHAKVCDLYHPS